MRKILVRVNNWIGDVVMISPSMRAVRSAFPDAEITLLAKTWVLEALRGSPFYDRLIEYDRDGAHAGAYGRWRLIRQLRHEHFDLALLFQKAFEAALFTALAGVPRRVGFVADGRGWLLTDPLTLPAQGHHVDQFLQIPRAVGADTRDRRLSFHITPAARDSALRFLGNHDRWDRWPRIAIHPGASKQPRAWHADRFKDLARRLAQRYGGPIFLLGGPADSKALRTIEGSEPDLFLVQPPGMSLQETAALLERCHLLVCNDSGPMHIAAAVRVPLVAVFGPGSPDRTGPYTDSSLYRALSRSLPCSPCRQSFFRECVPAISGKPYCLEDISVEEVLGACAEILGPAVARRLTTSAPGIPDAGAWRSSSVDRDGATTP